MPSYHLPGELLEDIDREACLRLLSASDVARLAIVDEGRPRIVVLNVRVLDEHAYFRTHEESLLARLTTDGRAVPVAMEVDSAFPVARSGWSVIAEGQLLREKDVARAAEVLDTVRAYARGDRDLVLRMDLAAMSGRRAGPL